MFGKKKKPEPIKKKKSLVHAFGKAAIGALLFVSGAAAAEPIVLALGHLNSGGLAFMDAAAPWLNAGFDNLGITDGLHWLAEQIPEFGGSGESVATVQNQMLQPPTPVSEAVEKVAMLDTQPRELSTNAVPPSDAVNAAMADIEL